MYIGVSTKWHRHIVVQSLEWRAVVDRDHECLLFWRHDTVGKRYELPLARPDQELYLEASSIKCSQSCVPCQYLANTAKHETSPAISTKTYFAWVCFYG